MKRKVMEVHFLLRICKVVKGDIGVFIHSFHEVVRILWCSL